MRIIKWKIIKIREIQINLIIGLFVYLIICLISQKASAQTVSQKTSEIQVSASVGKYLLNISGTIAPFASVSLIGSPPAGGSDTPIKATVADSTGNFIFSNILVATGFSKFCFDAVDSKRLGDSYSCMTISPITQNSTINNVFLPPTVGLEKDQINQGDFLVMRGYSMPSATVSITLSDGRNIFVTTDSKGFYQTKISMPKAGKYDLFAAATYQGRQSLIPARKKSFLVLNFAQQLVNLLKLLATPPLVWIWPVLLVIILTIILLRKFKPEVFDRLTSWIRFIFPFFKKRKKKKPLHHDWFLSSQYDVDKNTKSNQSDQTKSQ